MNSISETPAKGLIRTLHIRLASGIVLVTYAAIVVLASLQVFSRYVLGHSIPWTEELARYSFMWLIYVSIVIGLHRGTHASVDVLPSKLKGVPHQLILTAIHLISIALFAVLCYHGFQLFLMAEGQSSPALRLSMMVPYASLPFGSALMIIEELFLLSEVYTKKQGEAA